MEQVARNAIDEPSGHLLHVRYVLHDRDTKFCASFRATLATAGVKCITLPPRSPNLNAFAERWVRSVKQECLSKLILFGERALQRAVVEFIQHYLAERNHQGKGNVLLFASEQRSAIKRECAYTVPRATRRPTQLLPFTRSMNILAIRHSSTASRARRSATGQLAGWPRRRADRAESRQAAKARAVDNVEGLQTMYLTATVRARIRIRISPAALDSKSRSTQTSSSPWACLALAPLPAHS